VIAGQVLCAIACPFLYNAPAKVTSNWFAESERAVATMVGTCSSFFGISLGFIVPALFVSKYDFAAAQSPEAMAKLAGQVTWMFTCIAVFSAFVSLLVLVVFRSKPEILQDDPLGWVERQFEKKTCQALSKLQSNLDYWLAAVALSMISMFTYLVSSVSGQIILSYGIDDEQFISWLGTCFNNCGIVGSVLCACILRGYQSLPSLRRAALTSAFLTLAAWFYFIFACVSQSKAQMVLS
jgi:hypothetical protein